MVTWFLSRIPRINSRAPDQYTMATGTRRSALVDNFPQNSDSGRELFEACRGGDLSKVKNLVTTLNVNSRDTAGRKSTPLHFAAGALI